MYVYSDGFWLLFNLVTQILKQAIDRLENGVFGELFLRVFLASLSNF